MSGNNQAQESKNEYFTNSELNEILNSLQEEDEQNPSFDEKTLEKIKNAWDSVDRKKLFKN